MKMKICLFLTFLLSFLGLQVCCGCLWVVLDSCGWFLIIVHTLVDYARVCDYPQKATTILNHLQSPSTNRNHLKPQKNNKNVNKKDKKRIKFNFDSKGLFICCFEYGIGFVVACFLTPYKTKSSEREVQIAIPQLLLKSYIKILIKI